MLPKLVIMGAGGHAKVAIETILSAGEYEIVGLIDQDRTPRSVLGFPILGGDDMLEQLLGQGISHVFPAIGDNSLRVRLAELARSRGARLASAISSASHVSQFASIGTGVLVVAGAVINAETVIEDMAIINTKASVDHDCRIGAGAHIAPGATLAGTVTVGKRTFVGAGASIIPGITIGDAALIGAGACVIRDIPHGQKAYGVPARIAS